MARKRWQQYQEMQTAACKHGRTVLWQLVAVKAIIKKLQIQQVCKISANQILSSTDAENRL